MALLQRTETHDSNTSSAVSPLSGEHNFITLKSSRTQVCALVFGDRGSGKTTVATMYAPQPVALINYDGRAEPAILKAQDAGRIIKYSRLYLPRNLTKLTVEEGKRQGQATIDQTLINFEWALREAEKGNIRTICLDTITELEMALTCAIRGRADKKPKDYGESKGLINQQLMSMFDDAKKGPAHLIALGRAQEIWSGGSPTGQFKPRVSDVVNDAVDWSGHMRVNVVGMGSGGKKVLGATNSGPKFEMEIKKAGVRIEELLNTYTEDEWAAFGGPFSYACFKQYPEIPLEAWR